MTTHNSISHEVSPLVPYNGDIPGKTPARISVTLYCRGSELGCYSPCVNLYLCQHTGGQQGSSSSPTLNHSILGWAYSLGGEQLGCLTQTLVVGRKAWSLSISELTIASKDKRVGTAIHTWQMKRLEPGSAGSQMANNKIRTAQVLMPGWLRKDTWEACSGLGLLSLTQVMMWPMELFLLLSPKSLPQADRHLSCQSQQAKANGPIQFWQLPQGIYMYLRKFITYAYINL